MKTHRFDPVSFVAGLLMVLVGLVFLVPPDTSALLEAVVGARVWFWPVLLVGIGLAVLVPALLPRRQSAEEDRSADRESTL
jgi:hypothetical protein